MEEIAMSDARPFPPEELFEHADFLRRTGCATASFEVRAGDNDVLELALR
jgi:hypothetical protein